MIEGSLLTGKTLYTSTKKEIIAAKEDAKVKYLSCAICTLILSAGRNRYGRLIEELENNHTQSNTIYPTKMVDDYTLLLHWKKDPKNVMCVVGGATSDGVSYASYNQQW